MQQSDEQRQSFARSLNEEVREKALGADTHTSEIECFAQEVLDMFADAGIMEDAEVCVRGGRLGRAAWEIAGWSAPESDDEDLTELQLLAVLFNDSPDILPAPADELRRRFELAVNFVAAMLEGRFAELEPAADAAALGRIIHDRRRTLRKVNVHLATDGLTQRLKAIDSIMVGKVEVACAIWDIERLSRLSDPQQEEIEIDVRSANDGEGIPCLRVPEDDPHYDAFLCVVPAKLLYHAYEQYGQRLLELNVRAFLSATGKINKGIRETIRTNPDRFFAYNNGLAMTARRVDVVRNSDGGDEIVRIVGLQIVNGGQTTASIHRAWKIDKAHEQVSKVFVQAKLTVITTPDDDSSGFIDLVRSISKYANSQNAIKGDDLEANQPWHVRLEQLSRSVWSPDRENRWYYERSRGAYSTEKMRFSSTRARKAEFERLWPRAKLVSKTDLAKCWNAWQQRPEYVSRGGQKNFAAFMDALGESAQKPQLGDEEYKEVIGKVILFRDASAVVMRMKDRIPAYRANVVAYLVSALSFRLNDGLDFKSVWEKQRTPDNVFELLQKWALPVYNEIINSAGSQNVTEWCKKTACWNAVRGMILSLDGDSAIVDLIESDDATAVSECLRLTSDDWEKLVNWALREPRVHYRVSGVASTLRGYALNGWIKRPSVKQAKVLVGLLEKWNSAKAG